MRAPDFQLAVSTSATFYMMDVGALRGTARAALTHLLLERPDLACGADMAPWLERTTTVLAHNLASGRFAQASRYEREAPPTLSEYAQRVLAQLVTEWQRVEALSTGDALAWTAVLKRLERKAYFWLGPRGRAAWATSEAREVAAKTCADLWYWLQCHPFPFDVSFDAWSERALRNRLYEAGRARRTRDHYIVDSLDRPFFDDGATCDDLLSTDDLAAWLDTESHREVLRHALGRLDVRQARVIRLWYLEGWPAEEIAAALGVKVAHVYVLKHRGLRKLREHCTDEGRGRSDGI